MNPGMAVKLSLVLGVLSVQVMAEDAVLTVPAGTELSLKPVMEELIAEPTEVSVQPLLSGEEVTWPEHCLLSLTITPGESADFTAGNMVCITAERQIIEAVPVGEIQLGQCAAGQDVDCATLSLDTEQYGTLLLSEPLELTLQPRNLF